MEKIMEKLKTALKLTKKTNYYGEEILKAKMELNDAYKSFNEVTDAEYMDLAILNLNIARKKYELCIAEAKRKYAC